MQYFGSKELDASLLMMPLVGFLPVDDPRMEGTVAAIEKHLLRDGFVQRYNNSPGVDGLPGQRRRVSRVQLLAGGHLHSAGTHAEAHAMFERLLAVRNDVGLLSEEYDPSERRQLGNFPQAFSHLALVNTAHNLTHRDGAERTPAKHRSAPLPKARKATSSPVHATR